MLPVAGATAVLQAFVVWLWQAGEESETYIGTLVQPPEGSPEELAKLALLGE